MTTPDDASGAIDMILTPASKDLGDHFVVRRALPAAQRRMVGPFVFFDEMGPAHFSAGSGLDVRPHPHIGLSTVTYLFDGAIRHRDTLGVLQDITPGALNLMTAGRGIAHSERTPPDTRAAGGPVWGPVSYTHLAVEIEGVRVEAGRMVILAGAAPVMVQAVSEARIAVLGGESDGPRRLWWNFVASDQDRIEQAKADWIAGRFGLPDGETEFIPAP